MAGVKRPIVVVGAARSGTTMMRDAFSIHPDLCVCEYEMNYLWHYGNGEHKDDMLTPDLLTDRIRSYIQKEFAEILGTSGSSRLVEKTVANVLRLDYVKAVFPDCQFIHIIRDGRAVSASALKRWQSNDKVSYLAGKVSSIPIKELPRYGTRYARNRIRRFLRRQPHRVSWGPILPDMNEIIENHTLIEVCGIQWRECVAACRQAGRQIPEDQYIEIRYEDVVQRPLEIFGRLATYLDLPTSAELQRWIDENIDPTRNSKWQNDLSDDDLNELMPHIRGLIDELGYN
jgi:hypothetical protein